MIVTQLLTFATHNLGVSVAMASLLLGAGIKALIVWMGVTGIKRAPMIGKMLAVWFEHHVTNAKIDRYVGVICAYAASRIPDQLDQITYVDEMLAREFPMMTPEQRDHLTGYGLHMAKGGLSAFATELQSYEVVKGAAPDGMLTGRLPDPAERAQQIDDAKAALASIVASEALAGATVTQPAATLTPTAASSAELQALSVFPVAPTGTGTLAPAAVG